MHELPLRDLRQRLTSLADFVELLRRTPGVCAFVELKRQALEVHGPDLVLERVLAELQQVSKPSARLKARRFVPAAAVKGLQRIAEVPMYSIDPAPEISASRLFATRTTARPAPLTAILAVCDSSPEAR